MNWYRKFKEANDSGSTTTTSPSNTPSSSTTPTLVQEDGVDPVSRQIYTDDSAVQNKKRDGDYLIPSRLRKKKKCRNGCSCRV